MYVRHFGVCCSADSAAETLVASKISIAARHRTLLQLASLIQILPNVFKHAAHHSRRQSPRLRILLTGMVRSKQARQAERQIEARAVREFERGARREIIFAPDRS